MRGDYDETTKDDEGRAIEMNHDTRPLSRYERELLAVLRMAHRRLDERGVPSAASIRAATEQQPIPPTEEAFKSLTDAHRSTQGALSGVHS